MRRRMRDVYTLREENNKTFSRGEIFANLPLIHENKFRGIYIKIYRFTKISSMKYIKIPQSQKLIV